MQSHQPGVFCENNESRHGAWAQIKDSSPNVHRKKKNRENIKKTWNWNNQITDSTENRDVKKAALLLRQMWWKISLSQSKWGLSLHKEAEENHYCVNAHLKFPEKQFIECIAYYPSLLLGKLCGVDNPGAFACQGANRIISLYLLKLITLLAYSVRIRTEKKTEMCHTVCFNTRIPKTSCLPLF